MIKHSIGTLFAFSLITFGTALHASSAFAQAGMQLMAPVVELLQTQAAGDQALASAPKLNALIKIFGISDSKLISRMRSDPDFARVKILELTQADQQDAKTIAAATRVFGGDLVIRDLLKPKSEASVHSASSTGYVANKGLDLGGPLNRSALVSRRIHAMTAGLGIPAPIIAELEADLTAHPETVASLVGPALLKKDCGLSTLGQEHLTENLVAATRASLEGRSVKEALNQSFAEVEHSKDPNKDRCTVSTECPFFSGAAAEGCALAN